MRPMPREQILSIDGLRMFVREAGVGEPVLLLHGIPTSSFMWRDVLPVVGLNHRAIAPDLIGFGRSDKPRNFDYTVAGQADAVERLLDQLGITQVALVGHDMGALIAAELIARNPERVRHLVLTNTSLRPQNWYGVGPLSLLRLPVVGELAMALSRRWMLRPVMRLYLAPGTRLTRAEMDAYWRPFEEGFRDVLLRMARAPLARADDFERWRAALAALTAPVLIVWGALDPTFRLAEARDLDRLITDATTYVFEHANHFIAEDRPAALGRLIDLSLAAVPIPDALAAR